MPRKHKRTVGSRPYANWTNENLQNALEDIRRGSLSYREAEEKYKIPKSTLQRKRNNKNMKKVGRPTELSEEDEKLLVDGLIVLADWGYPVSHLQLRQLVKSHLDSIGAVNPRFQENIPGEEWCVSFLERHKSSLSERLCSNIKRARAELSREQLTEYFGNLQESLIGVSPENIINYDETNMSDDPGRKKVLIKRGSKRADRIIDSSKSSTSVMFAGTATGELLPLYVVYKAEHMHSTWIEGGWPGTRYNRSRSGWFDSVLFEDFFDKVIIKYFDDLEKEKGEKSLKLIIGDNLSSHMSLSVIKKCEEHGIRFVFMPPNATHLCQPLDVAFFRALKQAWRNKLTEWKLQNRGTVPKDTFPRLLKNTLLSMGDNIKTNIISGFKAAGIYPCDPNAVLKRLPAEPSQSASNAASWSETFLEYLKRGREKPASQKKRRTKLNVAPGQSVTESDFDVPSTHQNAIPSTSNQIEVVCYPSDHDSDQSENNITNDILDDPLMMGMEEDIIFEAEDMPSSDIEERQIMNARLTEEDMSNSDIEESQIINARSIEEDMPINHSEDITDDVLENSLMMAIEKDIIFGTEGIMPSSDAEDSQIIDTRSVEVCKEIVQENKKETEDRQNKKKIKKKPNDNRDKENIESELQSSKDYNEGDFVLVNLAYNEHTKKPVKKCFVAKIQSLQSDGIFCKFLRKSQKTENTFIYPPIDDEMLVDKKDVVRILIPPTINRGRHIFKDVKNIKFN